MKKKNEKSEEEQGKNEIENLQLFIYAFSEQKFYITRNYAI